MIKFDEQLVSAALEAPDDQAVEMMEGVFIVNDHHVSRVCVCVSTLKKYIYICKYLDICIQYTVLLFK